jgi:phage shock protein C
VEERNRNDGLLIVGIIVLLIGLAALGRTLNVVPPFMWEAMRGLTRASGPLALIILGIAVIVLANGGRMRFAMPQAGTRLYRSRKDRVIAGVAGGLAEYFGMDPLIVRLLFVVLALAGAGSVVLAYIILAVLVPEEPAEAAPPAPPAQGGDQPSA